ncbi:MAG TPA: phosphatase PAP2 family protein [Kofleriaceae bacterium]
MKSRSLPWRAFVQFGLAIVATVLFVELAKYVIAGDADAFDKSVALAIHRIDPPNMPLLDWIMIGFTSIGSGIGLILAVAATVVWLVKNHHRRTALILTCNALAAQGLNVALKHYVQRPRPTLFDEITRPETFSFPSGHSLSAMAIFGGIAAVLVTLYPHRRARIVCAAVLLIATIGFSRVYLGVHWPLDVLAGFAAGVPLLVATIHLLHTKNGLKITRRDDKVNVYSPA